MANYIELPVERIELDKSNPRIARGVAYYGGKITSEIMALQSLLMSPQNSKIQMPL